MAKYILSYTPLVNDKKEYVLTLNRHTNIYNDNNYIVAFNPWSSYSAEIIDDMVGVRKMRIKASRVLLKDATPIKEVNAVIEEDPKVSKLKELNFKNVKGEFAKVVKESKIVPLKIEDGISVIKSQVDDEVVKFVQLQDGNILKFMDNLSKLVSLNATNVGIEWNRVIAKGDVDSQVLADTLKEVHNALKEEIDKSKYVPFRFMNTQHSIGTLLHKLGYRSDSITRTGDVNKIIVGDNIGTQLNAILLQNIYRATDIALNLSKLNGKSTKLLGLDITLKNTNVLMSENTLHVLENISFFVDGENSKYDSSVNEKDIFNGYIDSKDNSSVINNRETLNDSEYVVTKSNSEKVAGTLTSLDVANQRNVIDSVNNTHYEKTLVINEFNATNDSTKVGKTVTSKTVNSIFNIYNSIVKLEVESGNSIKLDSSLGKKVMFIKELANGDTAKLKLSVSGSSLNRLISSGLKLNVDGGNFESLDKAMLKFNVDGGNQEDLVKSYLRLDSSLGYKGDIDRAYFSYDSSVGSVESLNNSKPLFSANESTTMGISKAKFKVDDKNQTPGKTEYANFITSNKDSLVDFLGKATPYMPLGSTVDGIEDMRFYFSLESKPSKNDSGKFIPSMESIITSDSEHGLFDEAVIDTVLTYLVEMSENTLGVEVELVKNDEVSTGDGVKDVELVTYNSNIPGGSFDEVYLDGLENHDFRKTTDVFLHVVGTADYDGIYRDVALNSIISSDFNNLDIETLIDTLDKYSSDSDNLVHYEKLESTRSDSFKEVDISRKDLASGFDKSIEAAIHKSEEGSDNMSLKDVALDLLEILDMAKKPIPVSMEYLDTSNATGGATDTVVDRVENSSNIESNKEVELDKITSTSPISKYVDLMLEELEKVTQYDVGKDVTLDKLTSTEIHDLGSDVDFDTLSDTVLSKKVRDVALETLKEVTDKTTDDEVLLDTFEKVNIGTEVRDTSINKQVKVDHHSNIKDVSLSDLENYIVENEYEGVEIGRETADKNIELSADDGSGLEDSYKGKSLDISIADRDEGEKNSKVKITISSVDSNSKGTELEGLEPNNREEYETNRRILIEPPNEIESGNKWSTVGIDISGGESSESSTMRNISIGELRGGDSTIEVDVSSSELEVYSKGSNNVPIHVGENDIYELNKEIESELGQDTDSKKVDQVFKITRGTSEGSKMDRNFRTDIIESDLGDKNTEIDMGSDGEGEGGEVIPKDPETPVTPKDPKQKIWSIMGKNYPSWQNWNPKKTR